ncbi:MAG TPA: MBL fold metallo-hydrolase [Candidatus Limnocylindrales bacterium]|nr:MBL fold metallo-hydrolase [Candidatus Limnocylindrales bacterium]
MKLPMAFFRVLACLIVGSIVVSSTPAADQVTVLYDAFGQSRNLKLDWGFSSLIEYSGKKILFDAGNNAEIFAANVKAIGVDLKSLDFVVISHRHGDHTSGLSYLLKVNPKVKIYVPAETFGAFGSTLPAGFYKSVDSLPKEMRYFHGEEPTAFSSGSPWPEANFVPIDTRTEVAPGIFLIPTVSKTPGTLELRELTLALDTPRGLVVVVGCSHAGIEQILTAASSVNPHIHMVFGGLHLVKAPDAEIERLANALHDQWKVDLIAPSHCTGEPAFAKFKQVFGEAYLYAGLGEVLEIR